MGTSEKNVIHPLLSGKPPKKEDDLDAYLSWRDERYSPKHWFDAFKVKFDLDPCAPDEWWKLPGYHVPATDRYTKEDDGLSKDWGGRFVWMNPPFGAVNDIVPWLRKFVENGNGIGCCWGRTGAGWFQDYMNKMTSLVFVRNKNQFVMPDNTPCGCAKDGVVLFSIGFSGDAALSACGLGIYARVK